MRRHLVAAAVVLGIAALPEGMAKPPAKDLVKSKGWHTSYESARAEAKRIGKPLMVVFRCEP
jgi:hypothetical protein